MIELGRKLNGRYKIIGNIGSGGMANVYLAHDLILDRDVAVKVLRFDFQNDKDAIRRFQREALAATELVHPNIVSVYDVGEDDNMQFLVMEYVKGTDLKRYIQQYYPIPYEHVVRIMKQVLSAMSLAHQHRIIHRDLKPQNILIDEQGNVKITDFGIAIALSETSITQTNTLLGSVHYLSPEQARGSMATRQSDIYSMGVILYEMLSGRVPFEGESAVSIALKHFQEEIPSLRATNPNIPQALENVVLHATTKDPADRYASAEAMEADLSTALSPMRVNEPPFQPKAMFDETKVIEPTNIMDGPIPPAFVEMQHTPEEREEEPVKEFTPSQPVKKKSKKKLFFGLGAVAVVLAAIVFFLFFSSPKDISVPDVAGMSVTEATEKLTAVKLKVANETKEIADDTIAEGNVVKTNPQVNNSVKEGTVVTLYVSSGKETVSMIDVVKKTQEEAIAALVDKGFVKSNITTEEEYSEDIEKGKVISQTPTANEEVVPSDAKVVLTISKGAETVKVPALKGLTKDGAQELLDVRKLLANFTESSSETVGKGIVISTNPAADSEVAKGSTVEVVISTGPDETKASSEERQTFPITVSFTAGASSDRPDDAIYDLYYADADSNYEYKKYNSERLTFNQLMSGYSLNITIANGKGAKIKINKDGSLVGERGGITTKEAITISGS